MSVFSACSKVGSSREETKTFINGYAGSEGLVECLNANIWGGGGGGHFDIYEHDIFHANLKVIHEKESKSIMSRCVRLLNCVAF